MNLIAGVIGLDSVSAAKVANVLHAVAHDPENPTAVIASIHQPRYAALKKHPTIRLTEIVVRSSIRHSIASFSLLMGMRSTLAPAHSRH